MDHVLIRRLEHLTGSAGLPALGFAVETRDRPGPAHKLGCAPGDVVWVQLPGGIFVARAAVSLGWVGEYSSVAEVRARTRGSTLHDLDEFWAGRPKYGYAAVARLQHERWIEPFWGGPRTYGYEWVVLENDKKQDSWLHEREPPRGGDDLLRRFRAWRETR